MSSQSLQSFNLRSPNIAQTCQSVSSAKSDDGQLSTRCGRSAFELWLARRFGQIWALDYRSSNLILAHQQVNGLGQKWSNPSFFTMGTFLSKGLFADLSTGNMPAFSFIASTCATTASR